MSHRIDIEPIRVGDRGYRYRVTFAGSVLIKNTRNPEYDACRALLAKGVTGRLELACMRNVRSIVDRYRARSRLDHLRDGGAWPSRSPVAVVLAPDAISCGAGRTAGGNFRDGRTHPSRNEPGQKTHAPSRERRIQQRD